MSEKPLLLSSAKSGVLLKHGDSHKNWFIALAAIGLFVVVVGAASVAASAANMFLGSDASLMSFGPAIGLVDPSALNSFSASSTSAMEATTTPITPTQLIIPAIGLNAKVQQVGQKSDGTMGTPTNFTDAAWYALGPKPGQPGNAVIDGHVDNALLTPGVFEHLSQLKVGDSITVADASGTMLTYSVTSMQDVSAESESASIDSSIFTNTGPSQLVLITCDGAWVNSEHQFNERLVVIASLK